MFISLFNTIEKKKYGELNGTKQELLSGVEKILSSLDVVFSCRLTVDEEAVIAFLTPIMIRSHKFR